MSEPTPGGRSGLLRLFVDIARFRRGPADVPVSRTLLAWCVVATILLRALMSRVVPVPFQGNRLAILSVDAGATLVILALVLALARRPERFLQTAAAVFGVQLVMLPVLLGAGWLYSSLQSDPLWRMPAVVLNIALDVWGLAIVVRILRAATEWPVLACIGLAIISDLVTFTIMADLFPLGTSLASQA